MRKLVVVLVAAALLSLIGCNRISASKPLNLEELLANFSQKDQEEDILAALPDSYVLKETQESGMSCIVSEGWSFADTEGVLVADYRHGSKGTEIQDGILLRISYWTLNDDLKGFEEMLKAINDLNLPEIDEYEQRPLALCPIYLSDQGDYLSIEGYTEPHLPASAHMACTPIYTQNSNKEPVGIEAVFWGADEAAKFCPDILKGNGSTAPNTKENILSSSMIRMNFVNDVGG